MAWPKRKVDEVFHVSQFKCFSRVNECKSRSLGSILHVTWVMYTIVNIKVSGRENTWGSWSSGSGWCTRGRHDRGLQCLTPGLGRAEFKRAVSVGFFLSPDYWKSDCSALRARWLHLNEVQEACFYMLIKMCESVVLGSIHCHKVMILISSLVRPPLRIKWYLS